MNHYYNCHKEFLVLPQCFTPAPKVTSAVIVMDLKEDIVKLDEKKFFEFLKLAFKQKRKTLKNNLKEYWFIIEPILTSNNYSLNVRAEELPYELFVILYKNIFKV